VFREDLLHLDVDWTPPNIVFASILEYDSLVFWRTTSLFAREVDESTAGRDDSSFVDDGVFVQRGDRRISLPKLALDSHQCCPDATYLDVDSVEVETSLGEVFQLLTQELVFLKFVVMLGRHVG
jgi:hypothetical protein